ncbi:hypothetical protein AV521_33990 [Streptomyces sp. IMTB 2501]|uniref:hypothetical protein n=1 Tax=Streptomyces sp. IMTB 2501 TaxID=1776340 RepID=UPI00096F9138|nr:hypothetical protein [Streptomyces sp. IMTB 2501]OLZ64965.1 hypothetical protein AV521_33990 [Streptomyces sp. IMTB 2501]
MTVKTAIAKIGALAATGAAVTVLASGSAFAGTNGQQLEFYDKQGDTNGIQVAGWNQSGEYVTHCFSTPSRDNHLDGWWWVGDLHWIGNSSSDCSGNPTTPEQTTKVEPNQPSDYWFITQ